jgi:hypothetical protein
MENVMTKATTNGPAYNPPAKQLTSCGDVSCELLVDPIPRPTPEAITVSLRPKVAKVTFVDHHKPNSRIIMEYTQSVLRKRGIEVEDEIFIKADASTRMPAAMLQSLSQERGLILCGISD